MVLSPDGDRSTGFRIFINVLLVIALFVVLYGFFVSIGMLGSAFKLFGKDFATGLFKLTSNPLNGLLIGILATSLVQSSSTTTSMVVGMVGAGSLNLNLAIPIIMGANIGTSVTNTIVSIGHITRGQEFKRAFSASIVHDFFNLTVVILLFPLEQMFHMLEKSAIFLGDSFALVGGAKMLDPLKMITKPVIHIFIEFVDKNPWIVLIVSLLLLFAALKFLTKILKTFIIGRVQIWFQQKLFRNGFRSLVLGLVITVMVQSSSITTSLIVPIAASGILTLHQVLPYTMGANIGTTITAILAALATGELSAIMTGFSHLLFNLFGVVIVWPFRRFVIMAAENFAQVAVRYRFLPLVFIIVVFFAIPGSLIYFLR